MYLDTRQTMQERGTITEPFDQDILAQISITKLTSLKKASLSCPIIGLQVHSSF